MSDDRQGREAPNPAVAAYKRVLADILDKRPSGTRQRLAAALGKNRSFVSQIANPAYAVPIPAQHLDTLFEVCLFLPVERDAFLKAYALAHPGRLDHLRHRRDHRLRPLTVYVPDFGDERRNQKVDRLVSDLVGRLARFVDHS